jgi:phospholipid/cholesterol/gamma-HCH transport system ATP-binding protein
MRSIVRLYDVHKRFGSLSVLRGVDLRFPTGRVTVVLGPSGCGKSVMLKHLVGLLKPDRGEVWYGDRRVDRMSEAKLAPLRQEFGFLFQQGALFDSMTVGENVAYPLIEHTKEDRAACRVRAIEVLGMVGLSGTIDAMPDSLSGGQRKRVALARAIVLEPRVILYDEPTTGLDPIRADVINRLIVKLQGELNVTSIVVTHDLTSAFRIADRMVMLHEGRIVMEGTPKELRTTNNPIVQRFLRGEATSEDLAGINTVRPIDGEEPGGEE